MQQKTSMIIVVTKTVWNVLCKDLRKYAIKITDYEKEKYYHWQIKKTNNIINKKSVIYAKKVLGLLIKNTIKSEIIAITLKNI